MAVWKNRRKKGAGAGDAVDDDAAGGLFDGLDAGGGVSEEGGAALEVDIEYLLGRDDDGDVGETAAAEGPVGRDASAGAGSSPAGGAEAGAAASRAGAGPVAPAGSSAASADPSAPSVPEGGAGASGASVPTDGQVSEAAKQIASSALAGLGVDIIEISRMENVLARNPHFKERVFTQMERDYCESKPNPAAHYALCFAAKEAVFKALGTGFSGMGLNDVQVAHDSNGKPHAVLSGNALKLAEEQQVAEVFLSLSYTHTTGVASAVAAREENIPPRSEAEESKQKLDAQFKRMKQMLDEIDQKLDVLEGGQQTGGGR